jgi:hypothetical protein
LAMPKRAGNSTEDLYAAEKTLLATQRVIPLFHLPLAWALSPAVKNWRAEADGSWHLDEVSIGQDKQ